MEPRSLFFFLLALPVFALACGKADEPEDPQALCEAMCRHVMGPGLRGCGHDDAQPDQCVPECLDHLFDGESNLRQVECGTRALSCVQWRDCGDLL